MNVMMVMMMMMTMMVVMMVVIVMRMRMTRNIRQCNMTGQQCHWLWNGKDDTVHAVSLTHTVHNVQYVIETHETQGTVCHWHTRSATCTTIIDGVETIDRMASQATQMVTRQQTGQTPQGGLSLRGKDHIYTADSRHWTLQGWVTGHTKPAPRPTIGQHDWLLVCEKTRGKVERTCRRKTRKGWIFTGLDTGIYKVESDKTYTKNYNESHKGNMAGH